MRRVVDNPNRTADIVFTATNLYSEPAGSIIEAINSVGSRLGWQVEAYSNGSEAESRIGFFTRAVIMLVHRSTLLPSDSIFCATSLIDIPRALVVRDPASKEQYLRESAQGVQQPDIVLDVDKPSEYASLIGVWLEKLHVELPNL